MKYIFLLLVAFAFYSCQKKRDQLKEFSEKSTVSNNFIWTAQWTNGFQENPTDMTKTVYVFLSSSDTDSSVCTDSGNLLTRTAYVEMYRNDHTIENPVWSLKESDRKEIKIQDAVDIVCARSNVTYGIADAKKFPSRSRFYPAFK